ncbi:MAG: hypothetical protein Q9159_000298 [Coniocarpon cinnabarinum]
MVGKVPGVRAKKASKGAVPTRGRRRSHSARVTQTAADVSPLITDEPMPMSPLDETARSTELEPIIEQHLEPLPTPTPSVPLSLSYDPLPDWNMSMSEDTSNNLLTTNTSESNVFDSLLSDVHNNVSSTAVSSVNFSNDSLSCPTLAPSSATFTQSTTNQTPDEPVLSDSSLHRLLPSTRSQPTSTRAPKAHARRKETPQKTTRKDSQMIVSCLEIVSTLEEYIFQDLKPLDIILNTCRLTLDQLSGLIVAYAEKRNGKCSALLFVIFHQICELIETGARSLLHREEEAVSLFERHDRSGGLSRFRSNARAHQMLQAESTLEQLERHQSLIRHFSGLIQPLHGELGPRGQQSSLIETEALMRRVEALSSQLSNI